MKRFLLTAACAFLSLGFLTSCQKEEDSVLELAQELTKELQTVTDYQTAEAAAPRVAALNKRLQNAIARPYAGNFEGSSLYRSADKDLPDHEGEALDAAFRDLAREWGRVEASFPVDKASDEDVSVPHMMLSVGVYTGGKKHEDSTAARYTAAREHMHGEDASNARPYPETVPSFYGSDALAQALGYTVSPSSQEFFTFDSADDVVETPKHVDCEPESTEETGDAGASATPAADDEDGDDTPSVGGDDGDDDGLSLDDDDTTPSPAADDDSSDDAGDDDGGLPSLDSGDDDGGLDLGGDDGGLDFDLDL